MDTEAATPEGDATARVTGRAFAHHDTLSTFANRLIARPKLHGQISLVLARSKGRDGLSVSSSAAIINQEEHLKEQRYERMMNRFQLRHVPLSPDVSTTGTLLTRRDAGLSTARVSGPHSQHQFTDTANDTATTTVAIDTSRPYSIQPDSSVHGTGALDDDMHSQGGSQRLIPILALEKPAPLASPWTTVAWVSIPWSPTSLLTRVRLIVLVLVFTVQLTYMPLGMVYYPPHQTATIVLDSLVAACFLINLFATCVTKVHIRRGPPITSLRAIRRHYRKRGLMTDVLAAIPFELLLPLVHTTGLCWLVRVVHIAVQYMSVRCHVGIFHAAWKQEAIRADKSIIAWILYSRYGHLVRIGGIVLMITLMAHYFACVWSLLQAQVDPTFLTSSEPLEIHMHSIYDALQLLQGQGLPTTTPAQDLFGSVAVLLGSIALAVIFGHVAILVSNFSANQTSYQRKMERVFAIMGKLQLPHPIRERVHQYYEYLHAEYESLDGEIVKFAKELSHTLELEVVLFKYMDVVMHVPHWRECSPDFQKQLVLNLSVRVYLPDDFIMRRGEVGTECYVISRGTCKQHVYPTGHCEPPTLSILSEDAGTSRRRRSTQTFSHSPQNARKLGTAQARFSSRYSLPESPRSGDGAYSSETVLKRGQAIGDLALIANYERSSDLRAITYVEMCVVERETFQRTLTRYPHDREIVLKSIAHHAMTHLAADDVPCQLMQLVRDVLPTVSVSSAIELVAKAMNPRANDPTIVFGVTEQLSSRLQELAGGSHTAPAHPTTTVRGPVASTTDSELLQVVREIQAQLARVEKGQHHCCCPAEPQRASASEQPVRTPKPHRMPPIFASAKAHHRLPRRHTMKRGHQFAGSRLEASNSSSREPTPPLSLSHDGETSTVTPNALSALNVSRRMLQDLVGTLWSKSNVVPQDPSHTPCADELFRLRRPMPTGTRTKANPRRQSSGLLALPRRQPDELRVDRQLPRLQRQNST